MKNKYRILKIIFTIGILFFLLNFSLKRFSNKNSDNITVSMLNKGVYFIDEREIQDIVIKTNKTGKIGDLDIPSLERKISSLPMVDSANVYLKLNGELNLDIIQRIPIFRLQKRGKSFYVDGNGEEFPLSNRYSYPCMLVSGNVEKRDYQNIVYLIKKINEDEFSKNFFVGISKMGQDYFLMTNSGEYKVEFGSFENVDFKLKGFKTFVEKYLIYHNPEKYSKISLKYDNQIVTTYRKGVAPDSIEKK